MPFINVHIGKALTEEKKTEVMEAIARSMPIIPGKTVDNTMIEISGGREMFMGGEKRELVFVDMRVFGPAPQEAKEKFVEALTKIFEDLLGIAGDRQYYNIIELPGWGSRGGFHTFEERK